MRTFLSSLLVLFAFAALAPAQEPDIETLIGNLKHKDETYRINAANSLGDLKTKRAVKELVEALSTEESPAAQAAFCAALSKITEKNLSANVRTWQNWWEKEGKTLYSGPFPTALEEKVALYEKQLKTFIESTDKTLKEFQSQIDRKFADTDIRLQGYESKMDKSFVDTKAKLDEYDTKMKASFDDTKKQLGEFEARMNSTMKETNTTLEQMRKAILEQMSTDVGKMGADVGKMGAELDEYKNKVNTSLEDTNKKLKDQETRLAVLINQANTKLGEMDKKTEDYFTRNEDRLNRYLYMAYPIFVALIFVVIAFMIAFSAIGGNRLKAMKETIKSAEQLIAEGREVAKAKGTIFEQLDKKRNDLHDFIIKTREENEAEMDRFVDGLSGNIEHRMREVTMSLRQKAEKELDDTMKGLRNDMQAEIRNSVLELRDKVLADVGAQQKKFFAEVEAHTLFLEASFLFVNGKHEEALKIYRRLLMLKPDHYVAWNNMGTIMRDLARFDEALEAYQKALTISPDNPGVLYNVAATYATMKKKDKMLAFLKKTVEHDPEYGDEALNDKCFREYWGDADFKDLAEG